jgi:LysR family glycine cleavage system transcriptional activator
MSRHLPSLTALRAFEAAARHLSFTKAAEELHVTPAAISNQVKALEETYGVALFRRLTRALALTEAGQQALPPLRQGFDKLAEAADGLENLNPGGMLTISAMPFFAAKWLVPRMDHFYQANPGIDVRIIAMFRAVDFERDGVDVDVRFWPGAVPPPASVKLMDEQAFPVCSPRLLTVPNPLRRPDDLRHHVLLHADLDDWPDWPSWLSSAGVDGIDATHGPRFNQLGLPVQAAIEGQGVALASSVLVIDDLEAGHLVKPFDLAMDINLAYYVVCRDAIVEPPLVTAFRDWLLAEAAA